VSLTHEVAACLGQLLRVDPHEVPVPSGPDPWSLWRGWLGERGLGLVPIREPREFSWPGPWLAILDDGTGERAAVAFGPPPDLVWWPASDPPPFSAVVSGHVIAAADVADWIPRPRDVTRLVGSVELIVIAAHREGPVVTVSEAEEAERVGLAAEDARRNLVTRGIDLNALVGKTFRVGEVVCAGRRLCEPCAHLQRLTEPGILRALAHKGGLRADILEGGRIAVGDEIRET
jgi:hypothetical protein